MSCFHLKTFFKFVLALFARTAKHLDVTTVVTYSHAKAVLGQSERAYYPNYFINSFFLLLKKVGLWNTNEGKTTNKPVQLNNMNAIDWTGDFWQELQCLRKQRTKKKGKALEGRTLKVVTIEVISHNDICRRLIVDDLN